MTELVTRRAALAAAASGIAAVAGCISRQRGAGDGGDGPGPPTGPQLTRLGHDVSTLRSNVLSGGVPQDGIPPIEDPTFADAGAVDGMLEPGDVVFGVERGDAAKAYPQHVLVHHEIVNDRLDGDPVSVTYCPLTGTPQGFERGETTFGVSGRLVNNNLVMYDRGTESRWSQIPGTAIDGSETGATLREFSVTWTTWERWRDHRPETRVLTEDTGHVRDYDDDPYGSYNPRGGYYANGSLLFDTLVEDDRYDPKEQMLCAKAPDGPLAVRKDALREAGAVTPSVRGVRYVAVYDPRLDTGYVYRNPDDATVRYEDGRVDVDGATHAPDELPLERVLGIDAMWFAWVGFYPQTEVFG